MVVAEERILIMADVPAPLTLVGNSAFKHIRHPQKRAFLRIYAETGNVVQSFAAISMHRDCHYHWLKDETYAEAFKLAQTMAGNKFEEEVTVGPSMASISRWCIKGKYPKTRTATL